MRKYLKLCFVILVLVICVVPMAHATNYTFIPIEAPDASATHAFGINNSSNIVGISGQHGFLDGPLTIDPTYAWHTFYGSDGNDDEGYGAATDGSGNIYVTGGSGAAWNGPAGQRPLHPHSGNISNLYVLKLASGWTISTIDSAGDVGPDTSIAIDSNNKVHISYVDNVNADLKYATNASGSWVVSTIDGAEGAVGIHSSIAIDSNNNVHISYYDTINGHLKYATNALGSWEIFTIDSTGDVGKYTSIAVDSNNKIHISYCDYTNFDLKYATNASGSWQTFVIDSTGDVGKYTSIGLDSNDNVHISYIDNTNWYLKYATNASGLWTTSIVDGAMGFGISMAIDSYNKVHISYPASTSSALKYATNATGSWVTSTIDSGGLVGDYSSVSIDSYDKIHISYFDNTNADLKYATNVSGSWVTSTLDSVGIVGGFTSIAVDSNDKVHISYYDGTNGDLKYATNATVCTGPIITTQPQSQTIQNGQTASLSVSASGTTPLSYQWYQGSSGDTSNAISGAIGDVYMTPPLTQTTNYWVMVTNSCGSANSNTATITVVLAGITVVSPNGGEMWAAGSVQKIRWSYTGNPGSYVKVQLLKGGVVNRTVKSFASKGTVGSGSCNWTIPSNQAPGADYTIRVTSTSNGAYTDTSDSDFTIAAPTVTVVSPNSGETWPAGSRQTIRWNYTGNPGTYVKIELLKGGVVNRIIKSFALKGSEGNGSCNWLIPSTQVTGSDYGVRITSTSNGSYRDSTDNDFTIAGPPPPPANVSASDGTYVDRVEVTWATSSGATSYTVYRATSSGNLVQKTALGTTSNTTFDDTTALVGKTYYYWVKASNPYGTSGFSGYDKGYR